LQKEILEIEEEDANELLRVFLRLVSFFAKFNAGEREFKAHLEMVNLTPEQKQLFTYVHLAIISLSLSHCYFLRK